MTKKLVISEQEKNKIKSLYGLNEQDVDMSLLNALLKRAKEVYNKENSTEKSTDDEVSSDDENTSDVDITNTGEIDLSHGNLTQHKKKILNY